MPEGMHRRRVAEIVGRNIYRLHGSDRAGRRIADPLFEIREFGGERRLIAQPRRKLAHQPGHFRTGLNEPENIVDQQQNVLACVVAEIFGHGQRRVPDAKTRAGRLIHLPEDQHGLIQHACGLNLAIQFLALPAALADAAEHADAAVMADHVMDQFHDQYRLADARAAKQAALAAAFERRENIDRLDAGYEHFRSDGALRERNRRRMNRSPLGALDRRFPVDRVAEYVEHPSQHFLADRDAQGCRVSVIGEPRDKPLVEVSATPRTVRASRWETTSMTTESSEPAVKT